MNIYLTVRNMSIDVAVFFVFEFFEYIFVARSRRSSNEACKFPKELSISIAVYNF